MYAAKAPLFSPCHEEATSVTQSIRGVSAFSVRVHDLHVAEPWSLSRPACFYRKACRDPWEAPDRGAQYARADQVEGLALEPERDVEKARRNVHRGTRARGLPLGT
jgi:hypothetical protein